MNYPKEGNSYSNAQFLNSVIASKVIIYFDSIIFNLVFSRLNPIFPFRHTFYLHKQPDALPHLPQIFSW